MYLSLLKFLMFDHDRTKTGDLGIGFSFHSLGIVSSTEFTFTTKLSIVLCIVAQLLLALLHKFEKKNVVILDSYTKV